MVIFDEERCKGCGLCVELCPLMSIQLVGKKAQLVGDCCSCGTCQKVCPTGAAIVEKVSSGPRCLACPVECEIPEGALGACKRYVNVGGEIKRLGRVHTFDEVRDIAKADWDEVIQRPLIVGVGSGTTYPDFRPAPFIVKGEVQGVEIVTVVTEAPLSYSSVKVKIDTDEYIGKEGAPVFVRLKGKRVIGHLCTEEYGSKIISLGGVNILTSPSGLFAAKIMHSLLLGQEVTLFVEGGPELVIKIGQVPIIDGKRIELMRVGCGSAVTGLFAPVMMKAADEVIVIDGHITALFSEHPAARYLGKKRSGIRIKGSKSTEGRYFLPKGSGWGGTSIEHPLDLIDSVDPQLCHDGFTLLVTDTTATRYAFFEYRQGEFHERPPSAEALNFLNLLRESCERSRVSVLLSGGVGGSARGGVTKRPKSLTEAVHAGKVNLTIGGAKPFLLPGGGINFIVDVEKIKPGSIYLTPTPALVVPVEFTMRFDTFVEIGGHLDAVRSLEDVLKGG